MSDIRQLSKAWVNPMGWSETKYPDKWSSWFGFRIPLYHVHLDPENPLTFLDESTLTAYQPDRDFDTDQGSIPLPLQGIPTLQKDKFLLSYLIHDSGCLFKGLYTSRFVWIDGRPVFANGINGFVFTKMLRADIDWLLRIMVREEGAKKHTERNIYWAVRLASLLTGKT